MEKIFDWTAPIITAFTQMVQSVVVFIPQMFGAVMLLLVGVVTAKLARTLVVKLSGGFERTLGAMGAGQALRSSGVRESSIKVIGGGIYWAVILFFVASASNLLELTMFSGWLDQLVGHLPNIVSGVLIILAGIVLSNLARDAVVSVNRSLSVEQKTLIGRAVQIFTLSVLVMVGVDQIGIDITVVNTIVAITLAALLGGLSVAFSLGARTWVGNLLGARHLNKEYAVGERIRIADMEGTISELTPTSVVLNTERGRMTIPAKLFSEESSLLVLEVAGHER